MRSLLSKKLKSTLTDGPSGPMLIFEALELWPVKTKLILDSDWSVDQANRTAILYRCFLFLSSRKDRIVPIPTRPIGAFWHAHSGNCRKYKSDCKKLFGAHLDYFPRIERDDRPVRDKLSAAFVESCRTFERMFQLDPTRPDLISDVLVENEHGLD